MAGMVTGETSWCWL